MSCLSDAPEGAHAICRNQTLHVPQIDLPFTPLGKALASGEAIRSWIRTNILADLQLYLETGEVKGKKGIVHYFLDGMDKASVSQSELEKQTVVSNHLSPLMSRS